MSGSAEVGRSHCARSRYSYSQGSWAAMAHTAIAITSPRVQHMLLYPIGATSESWYGGGLGRGLLTLAHSYSLSARVGIASGPSAGC